MEIGKVSNEILEKIVFANIKNKRDEVLVSAAIGEDNGIIDFGEYVCVVSTDPVTGATKGLGKLAIHISCNDISTSGGEPIAVLLTILCPPGTTEESLKTIMEDAAKAASEINVEIMGGHTEVTDSVNRTVISTTVIGKLLKSDMPDHDSIAVGDKIVLSKHIGIEGTSIIANELEDKLKKHLDDDKINQAKDMSNELSVVKEGITAGRYNVKYMHDITEGGVYGAVWEASKAINRGVLINKKDIPIKDITIEISRLLDIDPYRLISSGSMLMVIDEESYNNLKTKLKEDDIDLNIIGEITEDGIYVKDADEIQEIAPPESDELYKALDDSLNKNI